MFGLDVYEIKRSIFLIIYKFLQTELLEINSYKFVLYQLVRQHLILRYRRTFFGYLWTLINPILMMLVTAIVFSSLFKIETRTFAIFLFAGMIPWNLFNSSVVQSSVAFINNEGLIKKVYLPKILFPLSVTLSALIDNLLSFIALLGLIVLLGGKISVSLLFIPLAFLLLIFFTLGLVLMVSVATVFFRDLQYMLGIGMQALFFLTPIIYKTSSLAGKVAWLVHINPLNVYIELFRLPLVSLAFPSASMVFEAAITSLISLILGYSFFLLNQKKIVFRL